MDTLLVISISQDTYLFQKIMEYNRTWGIKNTLFDRNKTYNWNIFVIFEQSLVTGSVLSLFLQNDTR